MASKSEDRTLAVITHIIGIFSYVIGALIIFFLTKDRKVKRHAGNALNWQVSLIIYSVLLSVLSLMFAIILSLFTNTFVLAPIPFIASILTILNIVFSLIAAFKANEGRYWKYPLAIDFISLIGNENISKAKREIKKTKKKYKKT